MLAYGKISSACAVKGSMQFARHDAREIAAGATTGMQAGIEINVQKCSGCTAYVPGSKVCSMPPVTPAGALVGRDSELASLAGLIRQVARGRGDSVLIEGEPGIGKSALVRAVTGAPEAGCQVF